MRFKGRIRFGELETGDLDVVVEVDETHVSARSGNEVLGRWCLADVVAERVVADQFALSLGADQVTFRADDQVKFAYEGIPAMAEGWARFHSANPVLKRRAIALARRENHPSRLEEARQALAQAAGALALSDQETEAAPAELDIPRQRRWARLRGKVAHGHVYLESTSLGITRRVCIDCAHVSFAWDD